MFEFIWSRKYCPKTLDEVILPPEIREQFKVFVEQKQIPNCLFAGPPGVGKSSLAQALANDLEADTLFINASEEAGIDTIRSKVINFAQTRSFNGGIKLIILDEADGLSGNITSGKTSAQQALRNVMVEYSENVRFILTANYPSKIIPALHSRCTRFDFRPSLKEGVALCAKILKQEGVKVSSDQKDKFVDLVKKLYPDLRKTIDMLQLFSTNGELNINGNTNSEFVASQVYEMLKEGKKLYDIRKLTISKEGEFHDYHDVLTSLFEVVFADEELTQNQKSAGLLIVTEAMYRHSIVMDQEINYFSAVIGLHQLLN